MKKKYKIYKLSNKRYKSYLIINVYNEGSSLHKFLKKIPLKRNFGVILSDSPSTDGSTAKDKLKKLGVDILLKMNVRSDHSKTLMNTMSYLIKFKNLKGIVISDGNGKDDPKFVSKFLDKIDQGYHFIQGSRYLKKNMEKNTPISRNLLIKLVHAPLTSLSCRYRFTDTTNGFRSISYRFLKLNYFKLKRQKLVYYEFYFYICFLASRLGFKVCEIPVTRFYPKNKVNTKIQTFYQYWQMLKPPLFQFLGLKYKL